MKSLQQKVASLAIATYLALGSACASLATKYGLHAGDRHDPSLEEHCYTFSLEGRAVEHIQADRFMATNRYQFGELCVAHNEGNASLKLGTVAFFDTDYKLALTKRYGSFKLQSVSEVPWAKECHDFVMENTVNKDTTKVCVTPIGIQRDPSVYVFLQDGSMTSMYKMNFDDVEVITEAYSPEGEVVQKSTSKGNKLLRGEFFEYVALPESHQVVFKRSDDNGDGQVERIESYLSSPLGLTTFYQAKLKNGEWYLWPGRSSIDYTPSELRSKVFSEEKE